MLPIQCRLRDASRNGIPDRSARVAVECVGDNRSLIHPQGRHPNPVTERQNRVSTSHRHGRGGTSSRSSLRNCGQRCFWQTCVITEFGSRCHKEPGWRSFDVGIFMATGPFEYHASRCSRRINNTGSFLTKCRLAKCYSTATCEKQVRTAIEIGGLKNWRAVIVLRFQMTKLSSYQPRLAARRLRSCRSHESSRY